MRCGDVVFHAFDPVTVRLSLDSTNVQHEKLIFQLVKPYIEGFSVKTLDEQKKEETSALAKRKEPQESSNAKKKKKKGKK